MSKTLSDTNAERGILAGLIKYGSIAYNEITSLNLIDSSFTLDSNRTIFRCLDKIFKEHENIKPDIPLIYSAASDLGLKFWFQKEEEVQYLGAILDLPILENNIPVFTRRVKKLEIIRNILEKLTDAETNLYQFTGNEGINEIFGVVEKSMIDCTSFMSIDDLGVSLLSEGMEEYFNDLEQNPIQQVGISSGLPLWDEAIGGGLRPGSVNVIAARPKIGKSTLCLNIAKHIAGMDIPVLILDTEMSKNDSWNRLISSISQVENKDVETGKYGSNVNNKTKVRDAIISAKKLPIHYASIADQSLDSQISLIKRWLITTVGLTPDGQAKTCVIIYDYLKIMTESEIKNVKEHQAVGFLVSKLINFAKTYNVPLLAFVQMNRDGIAREDTGTVSLSDRILWFCSSLSLFKAKSREEIDEDGWDNGNRKLIPLECRYGPGLSHLDYINIAFNKKISSMNELKTKFEIEAEKTAKKSTKEIVENLDKDISSTDEQIPF